VSTKRQSEIYNFTREIDMVTEVKTSSLMVCALWAAANKPACGLAATVTKTMILDIVFLLTEFLAAFPGRVFVLADGDDASQEDFVPDV
jgi:hypothetical protein